MKKILYSLAALIIAATPLISEAKKVHTIGDSTMAEYSADRVTKGWGQMFQQFLTGITVNNRAKSGASSKSFYLEAPYWQSVLGQIEEGDYVIIQFAHNDEKNGGMDGDELKAYYTSIGDAANANAVDYRGTTASGTYKDYLRRYVNETRAKGATPIFVGAICRRYFTGSKIRRNGRHDLGDGFDLLTANGPTTGNKVSADDHTYDYPYQMRLVAEEMDVPFIDLTSATAALYESYGDSKANELLFDGDGATHTSAMGATLIARLCAQLLKENNVMSEYVSLSSDLTVSPSALDFGSAYKGMTVVKDFYVSGFNLTPENGTVIITAPDGITLSTDNVNFAPTATISYAGGNVIGTVYAKCTFEAEGDLNGSIVVESGSMHTELPVLGSCIVLEGGVEASVYWRLEKDDKPVVEGPVTSLGESFSQMYVQRYSNPNANTTWPDWTGFEASRKTQRCLIQGDAWPAGEIDEVSTRYIDFGIKPATATILNVDKISLFLCGCGGNGMRCKVYYSAEPNFANPIEMACYTQMVANNMMYLEVVPVVKLESDDELHIRIYPWYNGSATGKTLCLSDVTIHGVASDKEQSGIENVADRREVSTLVYSLDGTLRDDSYRGLAIVKTVYSDGTQKVEKVIR